MTDIVEKNRLDWDEYSPKYMSYNLSDSVLERLKARPESAFDPAVFISCMSCTHSSGPPARG